jgi:hypothetical protein
LVGGIVDVTGVGCAQERSEINASSGPKHPGLALTTPSSTGSGTTPTGGIPTANQRTSRADVPAASPEATIGQSGIVPVYFPAVVGWEDDAYVKDWNRSGITGAWYTYSDDAGSTISPRPGETVEVSPKGICVSGTVAQVVDRRWSEIWGAGVGFAVCATPDDPGDWLPPELRDKPARSKYAAGTCPTRLASIDSLTFSITGKAPSLRVVYNQGAKYDNGFCPFPDGSGTHTCNATNATWPDDWPSENPTDAANNATAVTDIQFLIASSDASAQVFDFCIRRVSVVTPAE